MSEDWHPISDDGKRTVTLCGTGYNIYEAVEPIEPAATSRKFRWCGYVPEFSYAEQWLADGEIQGELIDVPVVPKSAKASRG